VTSGGDVIALNEFKVIAGSENIFRFDAWSTPAFLILLWMDSYTVAIWVIRMATEIGDAVLLTTSVVSFSIKG
jgi:hypothetical protein